ncbi:MAG: sigma-70 family RNA polymerase sigma factor [Clostridia bacterium]|nr:sigma-70 family RNA polymerase sigma factor [Clostridia bacterium]
MKQNHSDAEAIWYENEPYIRRICAYKLSSHPDEEEDAVQEIALAFFEAVQKGTQIRDPKKWLTAVASNIIKDCYQQISSETRRFVSVEEKDVQSLPAPEEPEELPEEVLLQCKNVFLESLSEDERTLFRLRYVKRLKLKAVAKQMGISEGNVKIRIFRLKRKAKRFVDDWSEKHL